MPLRFAEVSLQPSVYSLSGPAVPVLPLSSISDRHAEETMPHWLCYVQVRSPTKSYSACDRMSSNIP
jgi:hypothetical protein